MSDKIRIAALCGSLRKASVNRMALNVAKDRAASHNLEIIEAPYAGLPVFDADIAAEGFPEGYDEMLAVLSSSEGLLIVSPEYNFSVPGGLKNAIDWASWAPDSPFAGKAAAIMGCSPGRIGTARMQYHLRQILVFLDMHPVNKPEVMLGEHSGLFNDEGVLVDAKAAQMIDRLLASLAAMVKTLKG